MSLLLLTKIFVFKEKILLSLIKEVLELSVPAQTSPLPPPLGSGGGLCKKILHVPPPTLQLKYKKSKFSENLK